MSHVSVANSVVSVEVSLGELLDKITILEIKRAKFTDPVKRNHVCEELETLVAALADADCTSEAVIDLRAKLRAVNGSLWEIEDAIRICERDQDFGSRFVELARAVYRQNDLRAEYKRAVNQICGSRLMEEKQYVAY